MTNHTNSLDSPQKTPSTLAAWALLAVLFAAVQFASLFTPPLMDDVDASHAQAAQHFAESSDWITAKVNGIRYIEKPPLPYWMVAALYHVFGQNVFSAHLPNALAMLGLRVAGVAVGAAGLGRARRALCRAGRADLRSGRSCLPASSFPRRNSASFC